MQPEVPMPIARFTRFLSALFPFLTRRLPFVVSRFAVCGGPSRTTTPPHPARPSGTRSPVSASCRPAAPKIAKSRAGRSRVPLKGDLCVTREWLPGRPSPQPSPRGRGSKNSRTFEGRGRFAKVSQGEPGSAGACTPQSRAATPAAPAVHGSTSSPRTGSDTPRRRRGAPRVGPGAPRTATPRSRPRPAGPAPHPRHPGANRPPVAPRRVPNPAQMRPAAPSVIPATAGIQPPHPGAPNPAEKRPAAPQEFFRKNSYCAREARFRAPNRPPPVRGAPGRRRRRAESNHEPAPLRTRRLRPVPGSTSSPRTGSGTPRTGHGTPRTVTPRPRPWSRRLSDFLPGT